MAAIFDWVVARYDVTNDFLSMGQDRRRGSVVSAVEARPGSESNPDSGAGTGTSTMPFLAVRPIAVACDDSLGMVPVASSVGRSSRSSQATHCGFH
jgi:demethylmenaquinone methyltransferase / 2-methoxy-6-polyprenyl-1,4-benzoquinol methylase